MATQYAQRQSKGQERMRATEFLIERWTPETVKSYFDKKKQREITKRDIKVNHPILG